MLSTQALDDDRVIGLVQSTLSLDPALRDAWLKNACAGDAELFDAVWAYVKAEDRMQGFLLDPLCTAILHEYPFEPGELVCDQFRILSEVGRGGMGVVYKALDEKLHRHVAIKCAQRNLQNLLIPEARAALEVSHPNVCKLHELRTTKTAAGSVDFLTMEYVSGETLNARIDRAGPLPEKEAREIALQVCAGLTQVHKQGVIHGDLKAGNIILGESQDGGPRAVITDFGLAKFRHSGVDGAHVMSAQGGTRAYMAPELFEGAKASIASDIYALGVILFELVAGHRPYQSEELLGEPHLTGKPPAVHAAWDRILARCLNPDPGGRFREVGEIAAAFAPSHSKRRLLAAAAAVVLAVGTGVATYERVNTPKESVKLAMLPFESDRDTAPLMNGLFRDTTIQLAKLRGNEHTRFRFAPLKDALRDRVGSVNDARAVLGATEVLHGTLRKENDKVVLLAYLTDARSLINVKEWKAEYGPGEMKYAPVALAGIVTASLHLTPLGGVTTMNASALKDYEAAMSLLRRNSTVDDAVPLMEHAVRSDPDSAVTHAGLAEAEWFKYFVTQDHLWLDRMRESARKAELRNPDFARIHWLTGLLLADAGRYEQAEAEYDRAITLDPTSGDADRWLGVAFEANNQLREALDAYNRAIDKDPGNYRNHLALGAYYSGRSNYTEAARSFEKAVDVARDEPDAHFALGRAWTDLGKFADAERELRHAISIGKTTRALVQLGVVLMYEGDDSNAISFLSEASNVEPDSYLIWMNLGMAYRRLNRIAKSREANLRGLRLAEAETEKNTRNGYAQSVLAYLCARTGDRNRSLSEIRRAVKQSPHDVDTLWMAAMTYEALGQHEDTLSVLSQTPYEVLADISRYPDMADLRRNPRFQELLGSRKGTDSRAPGK
jgi:serine/threonine protein kinase/tetratricopeptide (TPR) repeat protein